MVTKNDASSTATAASKASTDLGVRIALGCRLAFEVVAAGIIIGSCSLAKHRSVTEG